MNLPTSEMSAEGKKDADHQLKDEHVEPEHEELVQLTLPTGSSYQSPPQKPPSPPPPESPPHLSLLQHMPSSSSSSRLPEPPYPYFTQPLGYFHPGFISSSAQPPPGFSFSMPSSSSSSSLPEQPPELQPPSFQQSLGLCYPGFINPSAQPPPAFSFSMPSSSRQCYTSSDWQSMFPGQPPADQTQRPQAPLQRIWKMPAGWEPTIEPPFPWASSSRAKVLSVEEVLSKNITVITGDVCCMKCKRKFQIEYDLQSKFSEVAELIVESQEFMESHIAPDVWVKPDGLDCGFCGESKCVRPDTDDTKKRKLNWLFLFLGQMIGYCYKRHLKYFCKHNNHPIREPKDRLVYLTYTTLHCQLDPSASVHYKN